jgi:hypothetical protein
MYTVYMKILLYFMEQMSVHRFCYPLVLQKIPHEYHGTIL